MMYGPMAAYFSELFGTLRSKLEEVGRSAEPASR